jgi:hypothetical protein
MHPGGASPHHSPNISPPKRYKIDHSQCRNFPIKILLLNSATENGSVFLFIGRRQITSAGVETRPWAGRAKNRGSTSGRSHKFVSSQGPDSLWFGGYRWGFLLWIKAAGP